MQLSWARQSPEVGGSYLDLMGTLSPLLSAQYHRLSSLCLRMRLTVHAVWLRAPISSVDSRQPYGGGNLRTPTH